MLHETRKILGDDQIQIHATCVRVPVLRAHSEALNITFSQPVSVKEAYGFEGGAGVDDFGRLEKQPFPDALRCQRTGQCLLEGCGLTILFQILWTFGWSATSCSKAPPSTLCRSRKWSRTYVIHLNVDFVLPSTLCLGRASL